MYRAFVEAVGDLTSPRHHSRDAGEAKFRLLTPGGTVSRLASGDLSRCHG
jgi:hypothetical protein